MNLESDDFIEFIDRPKPIPKSSDLESDDFIEFIDEPTKPELTTPAKGAVASQDKAQPAAVVPQATALEPTLPPISKEDVPDPDAPDLPEVKDDLATSYYKMFTPQNIDDLGDIDLGNRLKSVGQQLAGFLVGQARGAGQLVKNVATMPWMIYRQVREKIDPGYIDRWIAKANEGRQAEISTVPVRKQLTSELPTPVEMKGQEIFEQEAQDAMQAFGLPGKVAYEIAGGLWRTAGTLLMAEAMMGGAIPGRATRLKEMMKLRQEEIAGTMTEAGASQEEIAYALKQFINKESTKGALKLASYVYATNPGDESERVRAAATALLYSIVPAVASGARTDSLAKLYTWLGNIGVSVVSGAYADAVEGAKAIAAQRGEDWDTLPLSKQAMYWGASAMPQAVTDGVLALGAKSRPAYEKAMKDKTLRGMMELAGEEVRAEQGLTETVKVEPQKNERLSELQALRDSGQLSPQEATELTALETKVAPPPQPLTFPQQIAEATTRAEAHAVIDNAAKDITQWTTLQRMFYQLVKDEKIPKPKGTPNKETIVEGLKNSWVPVKALAPIDFARQEGTLPSYMRKISGQPKGSIIKLEERIGEIKKEIDVSALAHVPKGREADTEFVTKAEKLKQGLDAGIEHLKTIDFAPEEFNSVVDGMVKGENKIPGFGESSAAMLKATWVAESTGDLLRAINEQRSNEGSVLITNVPREIAGGEPLKPKPIPKVSQATRDAVYDNMPSSLKGTEAGRLAIELATDAMPNELPPDPKARANALRTLRRLAYAARDGLLEARGEKMSRWDKTKAVLSGLQSMRYYISDLAQRTMDYRLYKNDVERERAALYSDHLAMEAEKRVLGAKGLKEDMRYVISGDRNLNDAVIDVLFLDPNNAQNADRIKVAQDLITSHERSAEIKKVVENIHTELQGATADYARLLQLYKFKKFWDKYGKLIVEGEAGLGDRGKFENLKRALDAHTPMYYDEVKGEGKHIDRQVMLDGIRILVEQGKEAALAYVKDKGWGTRKYYWMSERPVGDLFQPPSSSGEEGILADLVASDFLSRAEATGEINHRTGMGEAKKGASVFSLLLKHMRKLRLQAETYELTQDIRERLNKHYKDGVLTQAEADFLNDREKTLWGQGEKANWFVKTNQFGNEVFWKTYFVNLARAAWFAGRNMFQGSQFGQINTQYGVGDVQFGYAKMALDLMNKNSRLRTALARNFTKYVAQGQAMFEERMLFHEPGEQTTELGKTLGVSSQKLFELLSHVPTFADNGARFWVYGAGYEIASKYADMLASGRIGQGKFEDKVKLDRMTLMQQSLVREMLANARNEDGSFNREKLEDVIHTIADEKNANVNFRYRTSERSLLEQEQSLRPGIGIFTFPRGSAEIEYQAVKRLKESGRDFFQTGELKDAEGVWDSMKVIATSAMAYAIGGTVASYLIGEKQDWGLRDKTKTRPSVGLLESMGYNMLSPGFAQFWKQAGNIGKNLGRLVAAGARLFTQDPDKLKAALYAGGSAFKDEAEALFYFLPMASELGRIAEATGNTAAVKNIDALIFFLNKMAGEPMGKTNLRELGPAARRGIVASFLHFIFDTEEYGQKRSLWGRFNDSALWGEVKRWLQKKEEFEASRARHR